MVKESKLSSIKKVLDSGEQLTIVELAKKANVSEKVTRTYVNRLKRTGEVKQVGKDGAWKMYAKGDPGSKPIPNVEFPDEVMKHLVFISQFFIDNFESISGNKKALEFIMSHQDEFNAISELVKSVKS